MPFDIKQLLLYCVNTDLFAVLVESLETNYAVNLCIKRIVRALAYVLAGMNVCASLANKDVTCRYKLTVCALNAKTL